MEHADDARDDSALVTAAAGGSELAFRALYRAYVRPVYWIAHGLLHEPQDAEEITQETFLVAWRKLGGVELAGGSLLPWLATICRYQCANRRRRLARDRSQTTALGDESLQSPIDVEQDVIDAASAQAILREVDQLDALDREVFLLCATEGYSYAAAAAELGTSQGAVRNRLSRTRARLRTIVKES